MASSINHRIGLIAKQIENRYITYRNNQEIEKAFVCDYQTPPVERAFIFTRSHSLSLVLLVTGFISVSVLVLSKPVSFSKPMPQNMEIGRKNRERLANIQPSVLSLERVEKLKKAGPQQIKITPFTASPVISRKAFLEKTSRYTLLVNKRTKKLFVVEETGDGYSVVEEFPVSIGMVSGDKKVAGDDRTPEGAYTLIDLKTDAELPDKYGPYAAVLNYPNKKDLEKGKTGSGIWIHGTGTNQLTPDTGGCVELSDKHLMQLFSFISKGTKIIIVPESIDITPKTNIVQKNLISRLLIAS